MAERAQKSAKGAAAKDPAKGKKASSAPAKKSRDDDRDESLQAVVMILSRPLCPGRIC